MFLVLLFLAFLNAMDCPGWQPGTVATTCGGETAPPPSPGLLPDTPGANSGGNSGGTSPSAPPPWETAFAPTGESDPATDPKGWTWGFHKEKPTENKQDELDSQASEKEDPDFFVFRNHRHRRRIDRVHLSQHMLPKLTRC